METTDTGKATPASFDAGTLDVISAEHYEANGYPH